MNIFIIPAWYPSSTQPIAGIFTKEQVEAIADLHPEVNIIVSTWGHDQADIPTRKPWKIFNVLLWYLKQKFNGVKTHNKVTELFNPAITWSYRLPFGGATKLLVKANRKNLLLVQKKYGKIDVIHAHVSYPAGYIASLLSSEFNIPYMITEHMGPFPFNSLLKKGRPIPQISQAIECATEVVAVGSSLAQKIEDFGYRRPCVIPNVVDERHFIPATTPLEKPFVFFTLAGMNTQKGIDHLLWSIARWNPPQGKCEFWIGGDGPLLSTYKKLAKKLNIDHLVRWLGRIDREDAPSYYQSCHVFVLPSRHETFGVVYAEAIACGKPIIATRCGGPESIVNEINGLLIDIGDVEGLTDAMQNVHSNFDDYKASDIRHDFEQRFSRPIVTEQIVSLYRSIIQSN